MRFAGTNYHLEAATLTAVLHQLPRQTRPWHRALLNAVAKVAFATHRSYLPTQKLDKSGIATTLQSLQANSQDGWNKTHLTCLPIFQLLLFSNWHNEISAAVQPKV
jgi:hypothetical protein